MKVSGRFRTSSVVPDWAASGETLLSARGVCCRIGDRLVLDRVDLQVRAGETVALVGPNGAGKSTLLSVLSGDREPDAGSVEIDGVPLGRWSETDLARRCAVLPQRSTVMFPFSVDQVVRMGRAPWARTRAAALDDEQVAAALRASEIADLADRPVSALSGGEAARVALARVCAQQTQLMLLDEPTAALDIHHSELALGLLGGHVARGGAAVVVLHDLEAASAWADRVVLLHAGTVLADGPPGSVLRDDLLSQAYQHDVTVVANPVTGTPIVLPVRPAGSLPGSRGQRQL